MVKLGCLTRASSRLCRLRADTALSTALCRGYLSFSLVTTDQPSLADISLRVARRIIPFAEPVRSTRSLS